MGRKTDWGYQSIKPTQEYRDNYSKINWNNADVVECPEDVCGEIVLQHRCRVCGDCRNSE